MSHRWLHSLKTFAVSLRFSILFIFISLFMITVILLTGFIGKRYADLLQYTSFTLMNQVSLSVLAGIEREIAPVKEQSQLTAKLVEQEVLNPHDETSIVRYTVETLKALPIVQRVEWGDEDGNYVISSQENNGTIITEVYDGTAERKTHVLYERDPQGELVQRITLPNSTFDPRSRPWYILAKNFKTTVWTDVFKLQLTQLLALSVSTPVFDKERSLRGVIGLGIRVDDLLNFTNQQTITPNGFAFIVTRDGKLIAFPGIESLKNRLGSGPLLLNIHTISKPWLVKSLDHYNATLQEKFTLSDNGKKYLFTYKPIPTLSNYGWLIGVVVPESDLTNGLEKINQLTILGCLGIFIIYLLVISHWVNRIVLPIKKLVAEANRIKQFDLSSDIKIISRIKEVMHLTDAFQSLKKSLKSFQKYVPKTLVNQLVATKEDIRVGGIRKELAIFFSDIENFTSIAESMNPNQLMIYMCEYFEEMTKIISHHRGTIDKYIGDSMMAFWGAPLLETFPAQQAAHSALECQKRLEKLNASWIHQGRPPLITRIGLHLGEAIVGNLGSSERLNYTALGDSINIASRLEKLNKMYGTKIIVSEKVYQALQHQFVMRMIDCVMVRGKMSSTYIYELVCEHLKDAGYDMEDYQTSFAKGFIAYQRQDWDLAIHHFGECLNVYAKDTIAPVFINRCKDFKNNPPPPQWDGVWKLRE